MVITFVPWNPDTDMAEVRHDGQVVWQDSLDRIGQYFLHSMPCCVPVTLDVEPA